MSELDRFRLVLDVARVRSISEVARIHGIAQPTVSRAMAATERLVGRALFRRTADGSHPTPDAPEVLALLDRLVRTYDSLLALSGAAPTTLRFVTRDLPLPPRLTSAIADWERTHAIPVDVRIHADPIAELTADAADFAVDRSGPERDDDLYIDPIRLEPRALAVNAGHPLAHDRDAGLAEISASGVYVADTDSGCTPRTPFDAPCAGIVEVRGEAAWLDAISADPSRFGLTSATSAASMDHPTVRFRVLSALPMIRVELINRVPDSPLVVDFRRCLS